MCAALLAPHPVATRAPASNNGRLVPRGPRIILTISQYQPIREGYEPPEGSTDDRPPRRGRTNTVTSTKGQGRNSAAIRNAGNCGPGALPTGRSDRREAAIPA